MVGFDPLTGNRPLRRGEKVPSRYEELSAPHIDSFNYFTGPGLRLVMENLEPVQLVNPNTKDITCVWFENAALHKPRRDFNAREHRLFPRDCREAGTTYKGDFTVDICWSTNGQPAQRQPRKLGGIPIMTRSNTCWLSGMTKAELVHHGEEDNEFGGYFVCNGIERMIRMLIATRRNYVLALRRGAYTKRGPIYTEAATLVRCVRPDYASQVVRCHYLTDGTVNVALTIKRAEYFLPAGILLRCFLEVSDRELFQRIVSSAPGPAEGETDETGGHQGFVSERAEMLLRQAARWGLRTRLQCLAYIGSHFRVALGLGDELTAEECGERLLRDFVFLQLDQPEDKLSLLVLMLQKLYALVNSQCAEDNPDALVHHEILQPGHLLAKFMGERLEDCFIAAKEQLDKDLRMNPDGVNFESPVYLSSLFDKFPDVGKKFEYLMNTGNLVSKSGLDLQQSTGFTVVAERLNFFRYLSHFRSVHRGAYFAEIRTTTVRKLLPESWGFMCPVHTPDGAPCGLLNHFTADCRLVKFADRVAEQRAHVAAVLMEQGVVPLSDMPAPPSISEYLPVMLDARLVGHVRVDRAASVAAELRHLKAEAWLAESGAGAGLGAEASIPWHLEVVYIQYAQGGPYPGLYLFSEDARMIRPVQQIAGARQEFIGPLEQMFLDIKCPDGGVGGSTGLAFTHKESDPRRMLSVVASLTPYSDYNQSPRNMYQCQMGKQTMGTPVHSWKHRTDTKLYKLQNPQAPLARTRAYDRHQMDEYPNGTNAVVAVLAYTGYDMEDAMIINKSSMERGFAHASMYKTEFIDLNDEGGPNAKLELAALPDASKAPGTKRPLARGAFGHFLPRGIAVAPDSEAVTDRKTQRALGLTVDPGHRHSDILDVDGLPRPGSVICPGDVSYSYVDRAKGAGHPAAQKTHAHKGEEVAHVDQVALLNSKDGRKTKAWVRYRVNRNPVIGDKFASRAGQKGVLSQLWPDADMPFCERTGIRPDLIINPNAFPSRMTIGMLIESLASKAGALDGHFVDASPFQMADPGASGRPDHVEIFGSALEKHGFHKHGGEIMVSGITGEEFHVDIYIGCVYYQRLRHMVSDKFQVRSTGPINQLTRQPIKGRKNGGGIRFGEMERDSLLAHGASFLLHDRLHASSDYCTMDCCRKCGSLLSTAMNWVSAKDNIGSDLYSTFERSLSGTAPGGLEEIAGRGNTRRVECRVCHSTAGDGVERVAVPYVFKFLAVELAAMNIKMKLDVS